MSRGGAPSSHSKGVVCLEGGKRLLEQGGREDVAEMDGQGTPGLPCRCFSISTGMALKEARESLMTVALCHKQLRGVRQWSQGIMEQRTLNSPAGVALLVPIVAVWWLKPDEHFVFWKNQSMSLPPL